MAAEHDKHMVHKDLEAKEEEMEQLRYNMQKKASLQVLFEDVPGQKYLKLALLSANVVRSITTA